MADLPSVEPMPPRVRGPVPWLAGGTGLLVNPTAGTRARYELPEDQAGFGLATFTLIKAKVPLEQLLGRRNHPKNLFGSQKVETYLDHLHQAAGSEIDRLDSSESFVRPDRNAITWATRQRSEQPAMAGIEAILAEIWTERKTKPPIGDFFDQIYDSYADLPDGEREINAARDVIVIHMGSQSNLYAAVA